MSKTIPNYLRIHNAPVTTSAQSHRATEVVEQFWQVFGDATGWRIDPLQKRVTGDIALLPSVNTDRVTDPDDNLPAVTKTNAQRLAESATMLADQLQRSRQSLRDQEMELAARAAILTGGNARKSLADRVVQILSDASEACECDAAVMYLLDDNTETLKARAVFGLPINRLEEPTRELRGSRGDLEAMVQGVVSADEFLSGGVDTWNSPEPFVGGICAAICDGDVPIGTLWLFTDQSISFAKSHRAAAKLAASFLAVELARSGDSDRNLRSRDNGVVADLQEWQHLSLPIGSELASGWRADGMIESPQAWASGWHTWDVLPDGTLMLAIAQSEDDSLRGAIGAIVSRAALSSHSSYRHSPAQMLRRTSDTLWQTNSGDQLTSLLYLHVDPESGQGCFASAGTISAMLSSPHGYRPLVSGTSEPLGTHIDARPIVGEFKILPGETLFAYNQGLVADGATQGLLGECLRDSLRDRDQNPLAAIRRKLTAKTLRHERAAITLTCSPL